MWWDNKLSFISSWFLLLLHIGFGQRNITKQTRKLIYVAPTVLNSYYGTITGTITSPLQALAWSLQPPTQPPISSISFALQVLSIGSAQMYIDDAQGYELFSCVACGSIIPPSVKTSTSSIEIKIQGVQGANFVASQFTLQYLAVPSAKVPEIQWNRTFAINLKHGYGHISPVLMGGYLPGGSKQQWLIQSGTSIQMSLAQFSFGSSCQSRLSIYRSAAPASANLLFDGCVTSQAPSYWIRSPTGVALVVLTSPAEVDQKLTFQLTYLSDVSLYRCGSMEALDTLVDNSMMITDGSANAGMRTSQACSWLIQPTTGGTVTLFLDRVSLKIGGSVVVYDNNRGNGTVLWNGNVDTVVNSFLSIIPPPPLTSTGNALYVVYISNVYPSSTFKGFKGTYQSNYIGSVGSGIGQTTLIMSSAIDITPPGDGTVYTKGITYTWLIQPAYTVGPITFVFSSLALTGSTDKVTIYDGSTTSGPVLFQQIGPGGAPYTWIASSLTTATVVFQSAANTAQGGNFKLSYFADGPNYHCGFPTNPALLTATSMSFTDGSPSTGDIYPGQNCQWLIRPSNGPSAIVLLFSRFDLFGGQLDVYAGSVTAGKFLFTMSSGDSVPPPLTIAATSVGLSYRSYTGYSYNLSTTVGPGKGFALSYYGLTPTTAAPGNANGVVAVYATVMLSLSLAPLNLKTVTALDSSLSGSAVTPTVSTTFTPGTIVTPSNITWSILPPALGPIYFAFSYLSLPCATAYLDIHDGPSLSSPRVGRYCGDTIYTIDPMLQLLPQSKIYSWVSTSGPAATLNFVTSSASASNNFELSYYSSGPTYHCGFVADPATLTAPSMVLTDGAQSMLQGQSCQWIINPYGYAFPAADSTSGGAGTGNTQGAPRTVVLEFLVSSMSGGTIEVFDGANSTGTLLWRCAGCNVVPRPIVSTSTALFVRYTTTSAKTSKGAGFLAVYWVVAKAASEWQNVKQTEETSGYMLEMPAGLGLTDNLLNTTAAWHLPATTLLSEVSLSPQYADTEATWNAALMDTVVDGRPPTATFESVDSGTRSTCGVAAVRGTALRGGSPLPYLQGVSGTGDAKVSIQAAATQFNTAYLTSTIAHKKLSSIKGTSAATHDPTALFKAAMTCKYFIDAGPSSRWSINIKIASFQNTKTSPARLLVYGGIYNYDNLLYDSGWGGSTTTGVSVTAPCGKATMIVLSNGSIPDAMNYGLDFTYQLNPLEDGTTCYKYIDSLIKREPPAPINPLYFIIPFGSAGLVLIIICGYCAVKHWPSQYFRWYYQGKIAKYAAMATFHPLFTPKLDEFRNQFFMDKGECCICNTNPMKVLRLRCHHGLCLEDMKGYLESALGDISQFPVKCPMHYEGCTGTIEAGIAKRSLNRMQYDKFLEFSDRSLLGDGMRCIFCSNYVNFPLDSNMSMVSCPYCVKRFCIRCRKPWHVDARCPLDKIDDTLEQWKMATGAQKCPACMKLIEKDDPDTCNHMVHKITDGIPCIHERTDFCYLCGEAVTQDYPHDEVRNPGVNHFPEGVFQKCRVILAKEREEEREKLRKLRRNRIRNAQRARRGRQGEVPAAGGIEPPPVATDNEWGSETGSAMGDTVQLIPSTARSSMQGAPAAPLVVLAAAGAVQTGRPLRRTNRGSALPAADAPAILEDAPVPGMAALLTADMLRQHNTAVTPIPEGGRLLAAFDAQWNTVQQGERDPRLPPNFEEEW